jgi:sugar/nucleoside kinase (ribokinase family)
MLSGDFDVVVAGHICVDITPAFGPVPGRRVEDILRPGKLLQVGPPAISTGGAVSNTGLSMRRMGLRVSLMGKCGDDPFGDLIIRLIKAEAPGAEAGMRVVPGEQTSYSIVIAPPGVDRMFLHCPGANDTFGPEDVDAEIVRRARLFHFGYPPLMKRMYLQGGAELAQLLREAAGTGVRTSLDMAMPDPATPGGQADWRAILGAALPHTDVFLPSVEEIMFALNRRRYDELNAAPDGFPDGLTGDDARGLADQCLAMGARIVVIKCGHVGAYLQVTRDARALKGLAARPADWAGAALFEPACLVRDIKSATGAGDSAIAGFLCALLKGEAPAWCMAALTAVGAQNLSALDSVSGVRSWGETVAQIEAGPEKAELPEGLEGLRR